MGRWVVVVFFLLASLCLSSVVVEAWWEDVCVLETVKVTAYYSPMEGQDYYVKWSLEDDKILNGEGTHGASWKPVFDGMIAAPKTYAFGTRIYIPWWGIGQVEDRWWAIVEAGERGEIYDRLDIYAWVWQQGLDVALEFGVRYFDVYICPPGVWGDQVWFDFQQIPVGKAPVATLWEVSLKPGDSNRRVRILQQYLVRIGYLQKNELSTYFDAQTAQALCLFQKQHMSFRADSRWCGWFGTQTQKALFTYLASLSSTGSSEEESQRSAVVVETSVNAWVVWSTDAGSLVSVSDRFFEPWGELRMYRFQEPLKPGDEGKEIRVLQRKLQWLRYYPIDHEISWAYDTTTIRALYALQLDHGLLEWTEDPSVFWYFWPRTRALLNSL